MLHGKRKVCHTGMIFMKITQPGSDPAQPGGVGHSRSCPNRTRFERVREPIRCDAHWMLGSPTSRHCWHTPVQNFNNFFCFINHLQSIINTEINILVLGCCFLQILGMQKIKRRLYFYNSPVVYQTTVVRDCRYSRLNSFSSSLIKTRPFRILWILKLRALLHVSCSAKIIFM